MLDDIVQCFLGNEEKVAAELSGDRVTRNFLGEFQLAGQPRFLAAGRRILRR